MRLIARVLDCEHDARMIQCTQPGDSVCLVTNDVETFALYVDNLVQRCAVGTSAAVAMAVACFDRWFNRHGEPNTPAVATTCNCFRKALMLLVLSWRITHLRWAVKLSGMYDTPTKNTHMLTGTQIRGTQISSRVHYLSPLQQRQRLHASLPSQKISRLGL